MALQTQSTMLHRHEVEKLTGLSRSTLYQRIRQKEFPAPIDISGIGAQRATVRWRVSDIQAWIAARIEASRKAA